MRWTTDVACMGNMKGKDNMETRYQNRYSVWGCEQDSLGTEEGPVTGCCEYGDEPSVSIKGGGFVDKLSAFLYRAGWLEN